MEILADLSKSSGAFKTTLEIISSRFEGFVYSDKLTAQSTSPFYKKLPFFELVGSLELSKNSETQRLEILINEMTQKLKFREQDVSLLLRKNLALK
jgi:hypothetical protein